MAQKKTTKLLLTIKDLMKIKGTDNYNTAHLEHKGIRDALGNGKRKRHLTIKEYCDYESLPYEEILAFLKGESLFPASD